MAFSKIQQHQPIVIGIRKISENETGASEYCAVDSPVKLLPKPRIFPTQSEKIDVEIVYLSILFALCEIELAP